MYVDDGGKGKEIKTDVLKHNIKMKVRTSHNVIFHLHFILITLCIILLKY